MKNKTFDQQYENIGYYRMIKYPDDSKMNIIKFEDLSLKCEICSERTEWISRKYHLPVCSEKCLKKLIEECKDEKE